MELKEENLKFLSTSLLISHDTLDNYAHKPYKY